MYAELHCHSAFSFLDGASPPDELLAEAHRLGYPALALTDRNGVYGSLAFAHAAQPLVFRWKAHPVELRSAVVKSDQPHCFAITADGRGVHAERTFTLRTTADGSSTVVVSHETQVGPLPWLGRAFLAPRLHAVNQAMFDDLVKAATTTR